ncbi:MAG: YbaB/EbfC family nucleoid-associated protein [Bacteroidetes bacterium]|nr:MAG: YbaB/EbfC family nucleoid-associated protein [Bacteroidota bacterium]
MFDMMKIMGQIKEAQGKIKAAQNNLVNITAEGEAGAGLVKAVVNGKKLLVDLCIDESLNSPDDAEMRKDLIIAAVNKAIEAVEEKARQMMKESTEGLLPNIPGLDIGSILNG